MDCFQESVGNGYEVECCQGIAKGYEQERVLKKSGVMKELAG